MIFALISSIICEKSKVFILAHNNNKDIDLDKPRFPILSNENNNFQCSKRQPDLTIKLFNFKMTLFCTEAEKYEIYYEDLIDFQIIVNGSLTFLLENVNKELLYDRIEKITKSIKFLKVTHIEFENFDDCSSIITYIPLFPNDSQIWVHVSQSCIWVNESSEITQYWDSMISDNQWSKMCSGNSYHGAWLHYNKDYNEKRGNVSVIDKKSLLIITIVAVVLIIALIVSLFFVGFYCRYGSHDYPSI